MNTRSYRTVAAISLLALFAGGCTSDDKGDAAKVSYESPQAVFDAAKAAVDKSDWSAFCMCLEPGSRDKLAAMFAMMSDFEILSAEESDDEGRKKKAVAIRAVFAKHGITEEMLGDDSEPEGSFEDAMMDFIKPIKDRVAFVGDMGKVNGDKLKVPIRGEATLSDLKEDGESAKGTITFKVLDQDETDTLDFKKVDGSWGIELKDGP